jgi:hypothetical protein
MYRQDDMFLNTEMSLTTDFSKVFDDEDIIYRMDCEATEIDCIGIDDLVTNNNQTMTDESFLHDDGWFDLSFMNADAVSIENNEEFVANKNMSTKSAFTSSYLATTSGFSNFYFEKSKDALKNCCSSVFYHAKK